MTEDELHRLLESVVLSEIPNELALFEAVGWDTVRAVVKGELESKARRRRPTEAEMGLDQGVAALHFVGVALTVWKAYSETRAAKRRAMSEDTRQDTIAHWERELAQVGLTPEESKRIAIRLAASIGTF